MQIYRTFNPRLSAALSAALIVLITVIVPALFKTWFVEESGNLKIMPGIGPILAIALLMHRKWALPAAQGFFTICFAFTLYLSVSHAAERPGYLLLLLLNALLLLLLFNHPKE